MPRSAMRGYDIMHDKNMGAGVGLVGVVGVVVDKRKPCVNLMTPQYVRTSDHLIYQRKQWRGVQLKGTQQMSIPCTPSDVRTWKNILTRLRRNNAEAAEEQEIDSDSGKAAVEEEGETQQVEKRADLR